MNEDGRRVQERFFFVLPRRKRVVLTIQMRTRSQGDEKLRAVRVRAFVGHTE